MAERPRELELIAFSRRRKASFGVCRAECDVHCDDDPNPGQTRYGLALDAHPLLDHGDHTLLDLPESSLLTMLTTFLFAYILGGLTFLPLLIAAFLAIAVYTSVPVGDTDTTKPIKAALDATNFEKDKSPLIRSGWLTVRHTFEPPPAQGSGSYVGYVVASYRSLTTSRNNKSSRPKDHFYVVLKGNVLFLYEDQEMTECCAVLDVRKYDVSTFPQEGVMDGELFAKRNAIRLDRKRDESTSGRATPAEGLSDVEGGSEHGDAPRLSRSESSEPSVPKTWFIFVRANSLMEDWYHTLLHAALYPPLTPPLAPLQPVYVPSDVAHLVDTLDAAPDLIPMRWLNALLGRVFFSFYRTAALEDFIISRMMRKLAKVKRPSFLTEVVVREVNVGNAAPTFSKPMLKELTKEGDASAEVKVFYEGEVRITIEAVASLSLGSKFRTYTVKLILAVVLRELEGNMLIKVKPPPSNRVWYGFTAMPRMELDVLPVVSERQIKWSMILKPIESRIKEIVRPPHLFCYTLLTHQS